MRIAAEESALVLVREQVGFGSVSPLEQEVVDLFDQLRARLLRYTFNFGLPVQDGEEIVQEVFLALFRHLQQGKSRENLRGWVFRVAHNLALKRRAASAGFSDAESMDAAAVFADPAPDPEAQFSSTQAQRKCVGGFSGPAGAGIGGVPFCGP